MQRRPQSGRRELPSTMSEQQWCNGCILRTAMPRYLHRLAVQQFIKSDRSLVLAPSPEMVLADIGAFMHFGGSSR